MDTVQVRAIYNLADQLLCARLNHAFYKCKYGCTACYNL